MIMFVEYIWLPLSPGAVPAIAGLQERRSPRIKLQRQIYAMAHGDDMPAPLSILKFAGSACSKRAIGEFQPMRPSIFSPRQMISGAMERYDLTIG
jgi:hypothetical protein